MSNKILKELSENYKVITGIYKTLGDSAEDGIRIVAAAEWLLDNYYIVERQIKDIHVSVTKKILKKLPLLPDGTIRIYWLSLDIVKRCKGRMDEEYILGCIKEYQKEHILETSELWALPIILKAAIIGHIRKVCERVGALQEAYKLAGEHARGLQKDEGLDAVRKQITSEKAVDNSYIEYLTYCLKRGGGANSNALAEIDKLLLELETSIEKVIEEEYDKQALRQISMGNYITSLSAVGAIDWTNTFDLLSAVEKALRDDPSGVYPLMDFESRDYYRKTIEKLSKQLGVDDLQIVQKAAELATQNSSDLQRGHIGYYIVDKGWHTLAQELGKASQWEVYSRKWYEDNSIGLYIGSIALLTLAISALFGYIQGGFWAFILALLPVSHIVVSTVNFVAGHLVTPKLLPKFELENGIEAENATLVVVPTLLTDKKRAVEILDSLETFYYANREQNLFFALAGDFKDGEHDVQPDDESIVNATIEKIKLLNEKYGNVFFYFHRKRTYNTIQKRYMGWERKRGALLELNQLLKGNENTSYSYIQGNLELLKDIKFVITLDADTKLPRDAAKKLVGAMLHPLNRPQLYKKRNIITSGYGLLQPKISVDIESANRSMFSRVFAGQGGIDPYSTVASDIYQDIFGESIFTGKGIYELDVFNQVLDGAFPENAILSHDLLEGSYIRCGLAGDVELVDGYPARYNNYALRQHRWIRGDWQLISHLMPFIRNGSGKKIKNPLTTLSRWKILDNLRRSLVPTGQFLLLLSFGYFPYSGTFLTLGLISLFFSVITYLIEGIIQQNYVYVGQKQYSTIIYGFKGALYQAVLLFVFLPHQAYISADAMLRTLFRVLVTRRNMLEWVTAADAEKGMKNDLNGYYIRMWISIASAIMVIFEAFGNHPLYIGWAAIFAVAWFSAPYISYIVSLPYIEKTYKPTAEDIGFLRLVSRRTWRYFEDFSNVSNSYIPPDNFQENPPNGAAARTSPTNIGLSLVSILAAYDLGYITKVQLVGKVTDMLSTVERLPKWNGHLYNWYETKNFKILKPAYVSTVDSGNFAGYLMTLKVGLADAADKPFLSNGLIEGLSDTAQLILEEGISLDFSPFNGTDEETTPIDWATSAKELLRQVNEVTRRSTWLPKLKEQLLAITDEANAAAENRDEAYSEACKLLIERIDRLLDCMDFAPLYCSKRGLFSIGFNVEEGKLTNSFYDLLASEARQASLIAIARGDVPAKHWFKMGRSLVVSDGYKGLASWSGTMFEYFMPRLLIRNIKNTLIDETYSFVVDCQLAYGKKRNVPWGVSESGFAAFDMQLNYQYKAFGVPELGYKRGLSEDTVIAPYASILALIQDIPSSISNMKRLKKMGAEGTYGFYEALDFTPERQLRGQDYTIVKSYMVHHVGMSLLSLVNVINNRIMQRRFHSLPEIRATEYLLHERVPVRVITTDQSSSKTRPIKKIDFEYQSMCRELKAPEPSLPNAHILSNSTFCTFIDDMGRGYSKFNRQMLTRWRSEGTGGNYGTFFYIRNVEKGDIWSSTPAPLGKVNDGYYATFMSHKAEFKAEHDGVTVVTEIGVSPEDSLEVRRLSFKNDGNEDVILEITSYLEPVMLEQPSDVAHPGFGKLFIKTEFNQKNNALIASRRPREEGKSEVWAFHKLVCDGCSLVEFETDRSRFIGRGRSLAYPAAMDGDRQLSNSVGSPIDPCLSLRCRIAIASGETTRISFVTGSTTVFDDAISMCEKYNTDGAVESVFELALTRSRVVNKYLSIEPKDEEIFLMLLSHMAYLSPLRQKEANVIAENTLDVTSLWSVGISGDLPILLYMADKKEDSEELELLLKAHEYLRLRGFGCDLVILGFEDSGYSQNLCNHLRDVISCCHARELIDRQGGVFLRNTTTLPNEIIQLFKAVARLVLKGGEALDKQLKLPTSQTPKNPKTFMPKKHYEDKLLPLPEGLQFWGGYGGFDLSTGEYLIELKEQKSTPLPWSNVIANTRFGFVATESGGGYTWSGNSRENKLSPWTNDFVLDTPSEVIYIRDDFDGTVWTITPAPMRGDGQYIIRHGFGYTSYTRAYNGIEAELTLFVPDNEAIKLNLLSLKNNTKDKRSFTIFYKIIPVMGVHEEYTRPFIVTAFDEGILTARNTFAGEWAGEMLYMSCSGTIASFSGLQSEFDGTPCPAFLNKELSKTIGAGHNPCLAVCTRLDIQSSQSADISFILGASRDKGQMVEAVAKYKLINNVKVALSDIRKYWNDLLGVIKVKTPDGAFDIMMNGRLLYQTYACRMLARTAFYQAGGAFGFRDQLQDSAAMVYSMPGATANQILRHASRQFIEGDVQHWWHTAPHDAMVASRGIRTRFSDDLLWLPFVTADYIEVTGDKSVLDFDAHYLEDKPLEQDEDERYSVPSVSEKNDSVYEHCCLAIDHALKFGNHGLPLMGSGDWNDGMNTVGNKGNGESIWLGFFLYSTLSKFIPICTERNDLERADKYGNAMASISTSIEQHGWDGSWYRRAYFDDGTPLGSAQNSECKIDSISQSWSVISGLSGAKRTQEALKAAERHLVRNDEGLVLLLYPPFDSSDLNPGYIKGYVPGVRENGGQYTHAAAWLAMAFAASGQGDKAVWILDMINPINHSRTPIETAIYKAEPYAIAADVYYGAGNAGRGGWTWYTGASGWMYRVGLEWVLGFKKKDDTLKIEPSIPPHWAKYTIEYRYIDTIYIVTVKNPDGVCTGAKTVSLDGIAMPDGAIKLVNDAKAHNIIVLMEKSAD